MRPCSRRRRAPLATTALLLAALVVGRPAPLVAQGGLTHTEDAATVPRGLVRLRVIGSWTRWDEQWITDADGRRRRIGLGAALAAESLGVARLPLLTDAESGVRALTGDAAFRLNVGRVVASASARRTVTPIVAEYGLTRRLTIGVGVPIVQTRTTLALELNPGDTVDANVGANPARLDQASGDANARTAEQLRGLAGALDARLAACAASPGAAGCDVVNAEAALVRALAAEARSAAAAVEQLYGTRAIAGQPFVPLRESAGQQAVDRAIAAVGTRAARYLTAGASLDARPVGAAGPAGLRDLTRVLTDRQLGIGYDSLQSTTRIGIGDVELSAKLLLLDGLSTIDSARGGRLRSRVAVAALVRLPTGSEIAPGTPFDIPTGSGGAVETSAFADLAFGDRAALGAAARVAVPFGEVQAQLPEASGVVPLYRRLVLARAERATTVTLDLTPRLRLGRTLTLDGHYGLARMGDVRYVPIVDASSSEPAIPVTTAGTTAHRVGMGATYSTREAYDRGEVRTPIEVSWVTLRTIGGSGGLLPRATQTQLQLRIYLATARARGR